MKIHQMHAVCCVANIVKTLLSSQLSERKYSPRESDETTRAERNMANCKHCALCQKAASADGSFVSNPGDWELPQGATIVQPDEHAVSTLVPLRTISCATSGRFFSSVEGPHLLSASPYK